MQTTLLIGFGTLGLIVLAGLGWRLAGLLGQIAGQLSALERRLPQAPPPALAPEQLAREVSRGLAPLRQELGAQLGRLGESVGLLARTAAQPDPSADLRQIAAQLGDLTGELRQSQAQLQQALHLLGEPGVLRDWTAQLSSTVVPLERAGASVAQHYQTSADLLSTTTLLLDRWNTQGGLMASSTDRIVQMLDEWAANELSVRQELREQISLRLEEVQQRSDALGGRLGQIEGVLARLARASEAAQDSGSAAREALGQLLEQQRAAQTDQRQLLEQLGQLGAGLARHEAALGGQLTLLIKHSRALSEASQEGLRASRQQTQQLTAALAGEVQQMTSGLHAEYRQTLGELAERQQRAAEALERGRHLHGSLPSRAAQWIEIGVLLAVLATLLFSR